MSVAGDQKQVDDTISVSGDSVLSAKSANGSVPPRKGLNGARPNKARNEGGKSLKDEKHQLPDFRVHLPSPEGTDQHKVRAPGGDKWRWPHTRLPVNLVVPGNLTTDQESMVSKLWDLTKVRHRPNVDHPWTALCREIMECKALEQCLLTGMLDDTPFIGGPVVDIGGNYVRHKLRKWNWVHSCNPEAGRGSYNACWQPASKCLSKGSRCWNDVRPVVSMSVHSLYYLSPQELADCLVNTETLVHFAVVHHFEGQEGRMVGEFEWTKAGDLIVWRAEGNNHTYTHSDCGWIWNQKYTPVNAIDGMVAPYLRATKLESLGETHLFKIELVDMPYMAYVCQDDIEAKGAVAVSTVEEFVDVTDNTGTMRVPKKLRDSVQHWLAFSDRNNQVNLATYGRHFLRLVREADAAEWYSSQPNQTRIRVALYFDVAEQQKSLAEHVVEHKVKKNKEMIELTKGKPSNISILDEVLIVGGGAVALTGLWFKRLIHHKLALSIGLGLTTVLALKIFKKVWERAGGDYKNIPDVANLIVVASWYRCWVKVRDQCPQTPLADMDDRAELRVPNEEMVPCAPKAFVQCAAFGIRHAIPAYPRNCGHNKLIAIRNRVIRKLPTTEDWGPWMIGPKTPAAFIYDGVEMISYMMPDQDPEKWLHRHGDKFYEKTMKAIVKYYNTPNMKDVNIREFFIKMEAFLCKEAFSARCIQQCHVVHNLNVGPWMVQFTTMLCLVFDKENILFYASKTDAETIGGWMTDAWAEGLFLYENDFGKLDGSLEETALKLTSYLFKLGGANDEVLWYLEQMWVTKCTGPGGWYFSIPGRRGSGTPDTSPGNTLLCSIACFHALLDLIARLMENGDDGVLALKRKVLDDEMREITGRFSSLGLDAKLVYRERLVDVEFCSGFVVPTLEGPVLICKLGRLIAKIMWDRRNLSVAAYRRWAVEVATGLYDKYSFVPILRVLLRKVLLEYWQEVEELEEEGPIYTTEKEVYGRPLPSGHHTCTIQTWAAIAERYDLTVEEIQGMEYEIDRSEFPCLYYGESWEKLVRVDCGDEIDLYVAELEYTVPIPTPTYTEKRVDQLVRQFTRTCALSFTPGKLKSWVLEIFVVCVVSPVTEEILKKIPGVLLEMLHVKENNGSLGMGYLEFFLRAMWGGFGQYLETPGGDPRLTRTREGLSEGGALNGILAALFGLAESRYAYTGESWVLTLARVYLHTYYSQVSWIGGLAAGIRAHFAGNLCATIMALGLNLFTSPTSKIQNLLVTFIFFGFGSFIREQIFPRNSISFLITASLLSPFISAYLMKNKNGSKKPQPKKKAGKTKRNKPSDPNPIASAVRSGIKSALTGGGSLLGGLVGGPAGAAFGGKAGAWLSKITGVGDYQVRKNSIVGKNMGGVPTFRNGKRSVVVSHREYLGDISGSTAFALGSYAINPGVATTFPWLSRVAQQYQEYEFHGLVFCFQSTSADALNSTNTALGSVVLSTQYNVLAPNFVNKQEMEGYEFTTSNRPSDSMIHPIECDLSQVPMKCQYVRSSAVPSGQDARFYDLGSFQIATVGMQAAATIGELWVSYEVELLKPRLTSSPLEGDMAYFSASTYTNGSSVSSAGAAATTGQLPVTVDTNKLVFPPSITGGSYYIFAFWQGATTTVTLTAPTLSNCTSNTNWASGGDTIPATGASSNSSAIMAVVDITGYSASGSSVTFSGNTLPSSGSHVYLQVIAIPRAPTTF